MNFKGIAGELKEIGFNRDDRKEIVCNILEGQEDFEIDDYRFIHNNDIDDIMTEELSSDIYMLGCFSDWFIADITGLDYNVVKKAQKSESFELLGALMLNKIDEVVQAYISSDGYGHHFSHYDGNDIEIGDYHIFRLN